MMGLFFLNDIYLLIKIIFFIFALYIYTLLTFIHRIFLNDKYSLILR